MSFFYFSIATETSDMLTSESKPLESSYPLETLHLLLSRTYKRFLGCLAPAGGCRCPDR